MVTAVEWTNRALIAVPAFFAAVMTLLITVNVVMRYVVRKPMAFEFELVQVMLLAFVWLTQAYIFSKERYISVNFLTSRLSPRARIVVKTIGYVISIWFFGMIAKAGWQMAMQAFEAGTRSTYISRFPIGPQWLLLPIGAGVLCLQLLVMVTRDLVSLSRARNGKGRDN